MFFKAKMNGEGLTFEEWLNAALAWSNRNVTELEREQLAGCWEAGHDPTDYASSFERA